MAVEPDAGGWSDGDEQRERGFQLFMSTSGEHRHVIVCQLSKKLRLLAMVDSVTALTKWRTGAS